MSEKKMDSNLDMKRSRRLATLLAVFCLGALFVLGSGSAETVTANGPNAAVPNAGAWTTYSYASGTFTVRHENGFVEANDRFYLMGGRFLKRVEQYDPVTDTWIKFDQGPQVTHHFQAVSYEGLIYIVSSFTGNYPTELPIPYVYIYDPHRDIWMEGMTIPAARQRGSAGAVLYNDQIYVVGGITFGHTSGTVGWLDIYDPDAGTWTALPNDMPNARDHFHLAELGGKLYAAGGRESSVGDGDVFDDTIAAIDVYDIAAGTWSTLTDPLTTLRAGTQVGVIGNTVYIVGGESDTQFFSHNENETIDGTTGAVGSDTPLNIERNGSQGIVYQDQLYIASGARARGGNAERSDMECFNPTGAACVTPTAGPDEVLALDATVLNFGSVNVGNNAVLNIQLTHSSGTDDITVSEAMIVGRDRAVFSVTFSPVTLSSGQSVVVPVTFTPTANATYGVATSADGAAAISFRHNGQNNGITALLGGAGTGAPTAVGLSGSSANANNATTWLSASMVVFLIAMLLLVLYQRRQQKQR